MSDALLTANDKEEALSRAYVHAMAAGAGYTTSQQDFDRDGIDLEISAGGSARPKLGLQLKATTRLDTIDREIVSFPLKVRNYDLLRVETQVPRILVVLALPREEADWLSVTVDSLIMRRCAFWATLRGQPASTNRQTVSVRMRAANRFDVEALKRLMDMSRKGLIE